MSSYKIYSSKLKEFGQLNNEQIMAKLKLNYSKIFDLFYQVCVDNENNVSIFYDIEYLNTNGEYRRFRKTINEK